MLLLCDIPEEKHIIDSHFSLAIAKYVFISRKQYTINGAN